MGHVFTRVRISGLEKSTSVDVEAVVDTGATLTVIPRAMADKLGLEVTGESVVQTGAGVLKLPRSRALI